METYKSKYTGEEIEALLDKVNNSTDIDSTISTVTCSIDYADSNPSTCVTYYDDENYVTHDLYPGSTEWDEWFGIYPCLLKDGVEVGKLNPNNFNKFIDGTDADITSGDSGDVMIAFPIRGLKIETINNNKVTISMTKKENDPNYKYYAHQKGTVIKDKFYFGAFKGSEINNKIRSLSGKSPSASKTISSFRTLAQANGVGYNITGFYQLVYIQAMFILKYKDLNSQLALGAGYTNGNSSSTTTGGTIAKGMNFGEDTGKQQMKVFGVEDFWGNVREWIDGFYCDNEYNLWTATDNFNDNHEGYTKVASKVLTANLTGWMSKVQGTTETGFVIKEKNGSATTYFADDGVLRSACFPYFGSYWDGCSFAGAFQLYVDYDASVSNAGIGSRLMFI